MALNRSRNRNKLQKCRRTVQKIDLVKNIGRKCLHTVQEMFEGNNLNAGINICDINYINRLEFFGESFMNNARYIISFVIYDGLYTKRVYISAQQPQKLCLIIHEILWLCIISICILPEKQNSISSQLVGHI